MPVTVTVCAMFQFMAVNVRVAGFAVASPGSLLPTATVTAAVGWVASATVNVSMPPASVVSVDPPVSTTVRPAVSLSVMVSAAPTVEPTVPVPLLIAPEPDTSPSQSAASMLLSTAVMVTVSVAFSVSPAAIVMVLSEESAVYRPARLFTVTRTAPVVRARLSVADTVAVPPSATDVGFTDSVTTGPESSSRLVTGTSLDSPWYAVPKADERSDTVHGRSPSAVLSFQPRTQIVSPVSHLPFAPPPSADRLPEMPEPPVAR